MLSSSFTLSDSTFKSIDTSLVSFPLKLTPVFAIVFVINSFVLLCSFSTSKSHTFSSSLRPRNYDWEGHYLPRASCPSIYLSFIEIGGAFGSDKLKFLCKKAWCLQNAPI